MSRLPPNSQIISPRSCCSSDPTGLLQSNYQYTILPVLVDGGTGNEASNHCYRNLQIDAATVSLCWHLK